VAASAVAAGMSYGITKVIGEAQYGEDKWDRLNDSNQTSSIDRNATFREDWGKTMLRSFGSGLAGGAASVAVRGGVRQNYSAVAMDALGGTIGNSIAAEMAKPSTSPYALTDSSSSVGLNANTRSGTGLSFSAGGVSAFDGRLERGLAAQAANTQIENDIDAVNEIAGEMEASGKYTALTRQEIKQLVAAGKPGLTESMHYEGGLDFQRDRVERGAILGANPLNGSSSGSGFVMNQTLPFSEQYDGRRVRIGEGGEYSNGLSALQTAGGVVEMLGGGLWNTGVSAIAGLSGIVVAPFTDMETATATIHDVQNRFGYELQSDGAKDLADRFANLSIVQKYGQSKAYLGDKGFEIGGPMLGALGYSAPDAVLMLLGPKATNVTVKGAIDGTRYLGRTLGPTLDMMGQRFLVRNGYALNAVPEGGSFGVRESGAGSATRRLATVGDKQFPTADDAFAEALVRHDIDPSTVEITTMYGKNQNLLGPQGQPWEIIRGLNSDGELIQFEHHANGHFFSDTNEFELPHYHGPNGEHLTY